MKSYSDLLSNRYSDQLDDKANKYLQFIGEAAVDMDNQIKELLNYSLVGQHKDAEWVNCNELVNHILTKLSNTISATDTKVVVQPLPTILAYATDMSTLFQNLISNALKFYSKARKLVISISVIEIEDSWKFEIKDNGIGIDEKYLTKIFAIFERLNNKEEFAGTGIGLAHCRKIVELHGGKIWAKSKLGEGSSFFFTIKNLSNSVTPTN